MSVERALAYYLWWGDLAHWSDRVNEIEPEGACSEFIWLCVEAASIALDNATAALIAGRRPSRVAPRWMVG